jgi:hypothetical protein
LHLETGPALSSQGTLCTGSSGPIQLASGQRMERRRLLHVQISLRSILREPQTRHGVYRGRLGLPYGKQQSLNLTTVRDQTQEPTFGKSVILDTEWLQKAKVGKQNMLLISSRDRSRSCRVDVQIANGVVHHRTKVQRIHTYNIHIYDASLDTVQID